MESPLPSTMKSRPDSRSSYCSNTDSPMSEVSTGGEEESSSVITKPKECKDKQLSFGISRLLSSSQSDDEDADDSKSHRVRSASTDHRDSASTSSDDKCAGKSRASDETVNRGRESRAGMHCVGGHGIGVEHSDMAYYSDPRSELMRSHHHSRASDHCVQHYPVVYPWLNGPSSLSSPYLAKETLSGKFPSS
jgi:hypothetical protein